MIDHETIESFQRDGAEFPGLADELAAGAPMNHPLFPVLWSAQ